MSTPLWIVLCQIALVLLGMATLRRGHSRPVGAWLTAVSHDADLVRAFVS